MIILDLIDYMDSVLDSVEIKIKEGLRIKKPTRELSSKEYDSFIIDPKASYKDMKKAIDAYYDANMKVIEDYVDSKEYKDLRAINNWDTNKIELNDVYKFAKRWKKQMYKILDILDKGIVVSKDY